MEVYIVHSYRAEEDTGCHSLRWLASYELDHHNHCEKELKGGSAIVVEWYKVERLSSMIESVHLEI